jgi:hypothetical protein
MIDLFMKEHPGVKIETKVVFDNDVTDEQYNEGLNTLLTELASDQRADIYDATYLPSEIKTKGSGYFEDLNQYIDADPNFNRDDYYDNILRAAEVDGKLYQIPDDDFSVVMVPIRIPNEMNNIDIGITAKIVYIALLLNFNPSIIAVIKNNIFCINIKGITDNIYPKM